jgi:vacuolar-type H+-ATPase subunit F/Vma7
MLEACYIGDELISTGFALAGVRTRAVPESAEELWQVFLEARRTHQLLILSEAAAEPIRERLGRLLETEPLPPVMILPVLGGDAFSLRAVRDAYQILGIEERGR